MKAMVFKHRSQVYFMAASSAGPNGTSCVPYLKPFIRSSAGTSRLAAVWLRYTRSIFTCARITQEHTVNSGVLGKLCGQPTSRPASVGATRRALQESPPASKAGTDNFDKEGSFASAIFPMDHTGMDNSGVTSSTPRNLEV